MTQNLTVFDAFCGAGGSSTGLVAAGLEVVGAANHWALAIETHNTNHPNTEHFLDDLQQAHPSRFPRTTVAWFSPECTNHSVAKGRKRKNLGQLDLWGEHGVDPAEERSRATMREVVEFAEYHRYQIVIVENVVDIRNWQHYDSWLISMTNLGYDHRILYLNAQFFGVPQSRDRFYAVFWKRGNRAPNLDFRPKANCPNHGLIEAVQVWKKPGYQWGRHGTRGQYIYRCPQCGANVMPFFRPASEVIDWSIPSQKIGERDRPLKEKTVQRVPAGLKKFGYWPHLAALDHGQAGHNGKVHDPNEPLPTQTTQQTLALVQPFIASQHEGRDAVRPLDRELPCITTMNNEHQLVTPPFIAVMKNSYSPDGSYTLPPRSLDEPLTAIVAAASQHALVTPPFLVMMRGTGTKEGMATPASLDDPLRTITTGDNHHMLVTPPFIAELRNGNQPSGIDEPLACITTERHHALVMAYYGNAPTYATTDEPLPTMTTVERHALITPEQVLPECGFRMLMPEELKRGMSFPGSYIILGTKRDQVKQIGNAVACNVAQWIAERCIESLA